MRIPVLQFFAVLPMLAHALPTIWGNIRNDNHQKSAFGLSLYGDSISKVWAKTAHGVVQTIGGLGGEGLKALVYEKPFEFSLMLLSDGTTGTPVPRSPPGKSGILRTKPAVNADHSIFFVIEGQWAGRSSDRLHAVNVKTGGDIWTYPSEGVLHDPPLFVGKNQQMVVVGQRQFPHRLTALNALDGSLVWSSSGSKDDQCHSHASSPVASSDGTTLVLATMCVDSSPGVLRALSAVDGTEKWNVSHSNLRPIVGFFGDPDMTISPDGKAGFLWAHAVTGGEVDHGHVILYAFCMTSGSKLWSMNGPAPAALPSTPNVARRPSAPIVSADGATVFAVIGNTLTALNATTGNSVWPQGTCGRHWKNCSDSVSLVLSNDGRSVFFATDNNHVCRFGAEDGRPSLSPCVDLGGPVTDLFVPPPPPAPPPPVPQDQIMRVELKNKSLCLDVPGGDGYVGDKLWLWDCINPSGPYADMDKSQQWIFDHGRLRFLDDPSLCVDIPGQDVTGTGGQPHLWLWGCIDDPTYQGQTFSYSSADSKLSANSHNDICVSYGYTTKGGSVDLSNCTGDANMKWSIGIFSDYPSSSFSQASQILFD